MDRSSVGAVREGDPVRSFESLAQSLGHSGGAAARRCRNVSMTASRDNPQRFRGRGLFSLAWRAGYCFGAFGSGNGDCADAGAAVAAAAVGFGLLTRFGPLCRGGTAGCSSANTGLGSVAVVADVVRSPGVRITAT